MISTASCRSSRLVHLVVFLLTIAAVAALGRGTPAAQSTPEFGITPIGQLGGAQQAPYDLNEFASAIVGRAQTASGAYHAFVQDSAGLRDLGTLGGGDSTAFGVGARYVVGQAQIASGRYHAFAVERFLNTKTDLGTLGGTSSVAYDASTQVIVGASRIAGDARLRAFRYENGTMTALPVDLGGDSVARGISDTDDIVGQACTAGKVACRPFLLSNGVTTFIGAANRNGIANRVNVDLDVVGAISPAGATTQRGFLYRSGVLTELGTFGGHNSEARGVNNLGDVVGTAQNAAGQPRAFLWRNGTMTDLNTQIPSGTGWVLESAAGISDGGQIVGYGTLNGKRRAFLLTPSTDLEAFIGGAVSLADSNQPRNGIEVGKTVEYATSVLLLSQSLGRTIYGARMTHRLTGPAVFISARVFRNEGTCTLQPTIVTCEFLPFDTDGVGREINLRARTTGVGAIEHTATLETGAPDPNLANNTISESNRTVALEAFTLTPATVAGGQLTTIELTLTGPPPAGDAIVRLTSSRPDIAPVPATFVMPVFGGPRRQLNIVPTVVSAPTTVQITASYGLVSITRTLTVAPPTLKQLYLNPTTIIGGCRQSQGRVVLTGHAPTGGALVPLTNTNSKATVPQNVRVPAGSNSVSFAVPTMPVTTPASGVVTAAFGGVSQALNLSVRPIRAQTVTLASARVRGGTNTVSGIVTLECPAVPGAIAVTFSSTNPSAAAATVPSITIPTGGTSGAFSVRTSPVASDTTVTIYATVFGVRQGVTLTVTP